jgi:hypothetical protein
LFNFDGAFAGDILLEPRTHVAGIVTELFNNNGIGLWDSWRNGKKHKAHEFLSCQIMTEGTNKANNERGVKYAHATMGAVISQNSWVFENTEYFSAILQGSD